MGFGYLLALRIAALFDPSANWPHRMWRYGTVAQLRELLDLATNRSPLTARAFALSAARKLITRDASISGPRRGQIFDALPTNRNLKRFTLNSHSYWLLSQEVGKLDEEYLSNWSDLIARVGEQTSLADCTVDIDLSGWLIGAHLRGSGLSDLWILNL